MRFARIRIIGAVIDQCRTADHVSRADRNRFRALEQAKQRLASQLNRQVSDAEAMMSLDWSNEDRQRYACAASQVNRASIDFAEVDCVPLVDAIADGAAIWGVACHSVR